MFDISHSTGRSGTLHDQVFKDLIGGFLPDFLTLVAPEPAGRLDLSHWKLVNKEIFTDWPKGRRRELDLLAEVRFAGRDGPPALVHVEIEARTRPEMGPRFERYHMQIRPRYGRPVLPILLRLRGGRPGIHLESIVSADFGPEIARFNFYSFGLARSRAEDYLAKDQPIAWALAALMRRPRSMSRAEHKMACLRRINAAPLVELSRLLLANCVETYLQLTGRDAEELEALQAKGGTEEVRVMRRRLTWAEQLVEEGLEKGVEKGREIGKQEGLEQGVRQTLIRQLGLRFGPLSDDVKRQVDEIHSVERLNQIADQILVAHSLEEIGLR